MSDCGRWTLVVIAMLGCPFSPYYAAARRRAPADPLEHVAVNAVLYGPRGRSWALTERRGAERDASRLTIGRSSVAWRGDALEIDLDEVTAPFATKLRGHIRVLPEVLGGTRFALDDRGEHAWWPIAPRARVEVTLLAPAVRFSGSAYLDANAGAAPLESAFRAWSWSRAATRHGAIVSYDVERADGTRRTLDLAFDASGVCDVPARVDHQLGSTGWGLGRHARGEAPHPVRVVRTLEDTPFYARTQIAMSASGEHAEGVHESLSLERFRSRWVQLLLPARMRRALHAGDPPVGSSRIEGSAAGEHLARPERT